jgi:hypothetical protein
MARRVALLAVIALVPYSAGCGIFGPEFPHKLSAKGAYAFGRVIAEDESDGMRAALVCRTVEANLDQRVKDAFDEPGTRDESLGRLHGWRTTQSR